MLGEVVVETFDAGGEQALLVVHRKRDVNCGDGGAVRTRMVRTAVCGGGLCSHGLILRRFPLSLL